MKSYSVRLSGLVSGKVTLLPLSRPAASSSGVCLDAAWSDAAKLGTRGSLPHNVSHLTTLACERRSIAPAEPTCADKSPSWIGSLGPALIRCRPAPDVGISRAQSHITNSPDRLPTSHEPPLAGRSGLTLCRRFSFSYFLNRLEYVCANATRFGDFNLVRHQHHPSCAQNCHP